MRRAGYRLFGHTADVGLSAWGPTVSDAFAAVVRGLTAVTFDVRRIRPLEERAVSLSESDPQRLLVGLLDQVLYLQDVEGFLTARAAVSVSDGRLSARLLGERYDPSRHRRVGPEVKAITMHQIGVETGPPARIRAILDI